MRRTISLDGEWERRDFLDEAWRWSDALRPSASDGTADEGPPVQAGVSAGWRPARVPGSAIDDAWRAGEIPNPYVDRNSLAAEWIPQRAWLYRRRFVVPEDADPRAALRFEGIDPGGTVYLDGAEIAVHEGMFVPLEVNLGRRLAPGPHELLVAVDPAPPMPSQVSRTDRARHHRSRMGYGWDFCPRMVHTGLWRSVTLDLYRARLRVVSLDVDLADDHGTASVRVRVAVEGEDADAVEARIVAPEGTVVASARTAAAPEVRIDLELVEPWLWWPNGSGQPALYAMELRLTGGEVLDERAVTFGVRSVTLTATEGARQDALPYTLVVNDRPTWIRGWNWTPTDACFGVSRPDRLEHLVELLRRANVNLLRVWGGGLIESEAFYDACDRAGILVWQEFAQSSSGVSNTPADDPAFVELMRREAESVVPLRAGHPSLAIWCGGNELADPDGRPLTDDHPVLAALRDVVVRLDRDAAWLPTSPSGPRFDNTLAAIDDDPTALHDVHGPWEHQGLVEQHALANATTSLLHSEFGAEGMTNPATMRATVSDGRRWTADRSDVVLGHRGAWWNNRPFVEAIFGGAPMSLDELARASQHLQADGLRTLVEGDRRRWPRNAGTLPWVFNEPFPNAWSNAAVDYFGVPKAAYQAIAEAYQPILAGASFASQAIAGADVLGVTPFVVNDTDAVVEGPWRVTLADVTGAILGTHEIDLRAEPNTVATGEPITVAVPGHASDVLVLTVEVAIARTRRLLSRTENLAPFRLVGAAALEAAPEVDHDAWAITIANVGEVAALEVRLADARPVGWPERTGAVYLARNLVTLLPGETAVVRADWHNVPFADRALSLSGWNVEERELRDG
jgi:beta-mannosidase